MKDIIKKISKNIFIFPLLLVMLTLIIGVSYAYYEISLLGRKNISLNVLGGLDLTLSRSTSTYTLNVNNAMNTDAGKNLNTYYEFSVSATASKPKNINYLIYLEEISNTIDNSNVFVYLTDDKDNMLKAPLSVNNLTTYKESNTKSLFVNGFSFVKEGVKVHNYRLRSWVSSSLQGEYKYKVKIAITTDDKSKLDQEGVYITNAIYKTNQDALINESEIVSAYANKFSSNISLSKTNGQSSITYEITIYNSTDEDYYFDEVIKKSYNNENITYKLNGISQDDLIASKTSKTFTITFNYKNNTVSTNMLSSELNFKYKDILYFNFPSLSGSYSASATFSNIPNYQNLTVDNFYLDMKEITLPEKAVGTMTFTKSYNNQTATITVSRSALQGTGTISFIADLHVSTKKLTLVGTGVGNYVTNVDCTSIADYQNKTADDFFLDLKEVMVPFEAVGTITFSKTYNASTGILTINRGRIEGEGLIEITVDVYTNTN